MLFLLRLGCFWLICLVLFAKFVLLGSLCFVCPARLALLIGLPCLVCFACFALLRLLFWWVGWLGLVLLDGRTWLRGKGDDTCCQRGWHSHNYFAERWSAEVINSLVCSKSPIVLVVVVVVSLLAPLSSCLILFSLLLLSPLSSLLCPLSCLHCYLATF